MTNSKVTGMVYGKLVPMVIRFVFLSHSRNWLCFMVRINWAKACIQLNFCFIEKRQWVLFVFRLDRWSCQFTQHIKTYLPWSVFTWECIFRRLVYLIRLEPLIALPQQFRVGMLTTCQERQEYLGIMCILVWGKYNPCYSCLPQQEKLERGSVLYHW